MLTRKEQDILDMLEAHADAQGIEIVSVEITGAKKSPTVRVYIDTPRGVSFEDITTAEAWISALLDASDPFPGAYVLEVSSPGIDRVLRTPAHFKRFCGQTCVIKCVEAVDGRANFTGIIKQANDDCIVLDIDGELYNISFTNIKKANLKGILDFKRKEEN